MQEQTLGEVARTWEMIEILKDLGLTYDEIEKFQKTIACPRCGHGFIGFPEGWAWRSHLRTCRGK